MENLGQKLKKSPPALENAPKPGLATWAIGVLLIGLGMIIPVARAGAAPDVSALNSKIDAAKSQAQALEGKVQANAGALATARSQAQSAAAKEGELTAVLDNGKQRSAELSAKLNRAEAKLRRARARFDRSQKALSDRLVSIYTSSQPDSTAMLLNSDGFDDLATRAEMLGRIQDADAALVDRVRSLRKQVAGTVETVDAAKQRSDAHNARVEAARQQIGLIRAQAEGEANQLAAAQAAQQQSLASLQSNVGALTKRAEKAREAEARRAARVAAAAAEPATQPEAPADTGNWNGNWAIPSSIVMCESGGNFDAVNPSSGAGGAYQILPSTWELYGGHGLPQNASPAEQSAIAAQIYADSGGSAWVCAG